MTREQNLLPLILGGLVLICVTAITAWFFTHFEQVTQEIPLGASSEARRNPLLAAERFLSSVGMEVESVPGRTLLRKLPPSEDTLVVRGLGPLSHARREALADWIEQGGRLVVEATEPWDEDATGDDFLASYDIHLMQSSDDEPEGEVQAEVLVESTHGTLVLDIALEADWYLEGGDVDAARVAADGRVRVIQQDAGDGLLTALSDTELFTNDSIGEHDNALFLAHLAEPEPGGKVWLLYDSSVPWLGALLWSAAPQMIVSLGVLLAVWVWSLGRRLGPLQTPADRRRRDLLEHMDATGGFLWRQRLGSHLVEASRVRVLGAWERQRPHLRHLDAVARAQGISEATGRPFDGVHEALIGQADDTGGFVRQAARLQSLWLAARPGHRGRAHRARPRRDGDEPTG